MSDVNENFRNFILKNNQYLSNVENGTISKMSSALDSVKSEVQGKLNELQKYGTGYTKEYRLMQMRVQLTEIERVMSTASLTASGILEEVLRDVTIVQDDIYSAMLSYEFSKIGINTVSLPYSQIDYIINNQMIYQYRDMTIGDGLLWNNKFAVDTIRTSLTQSMIVGEDIAKAVNRLIGSGAGKFTGLVGKDLKYKMSMIARSEIMNVSNQVARDIYAENTDVLKEVQFTATMDTRTCQQCLSLEGMTYRLKPEGDHDGPLLPLHPFCRCVYCPITYSWEELRKRYPSASADNEIKKTFTGKKLESISYSDWLRSLNEVEAIKLIGKKRYELFIEGKIKPKSMINNGKILSIDEFKNIFIKT